MASDDQSAEGALAIAIRDRQIGRPPDPASLLQLAPIKGEEPRFVETVGRHLIVSQAKEALELLAQKR